MAFVNFFVTFAVLFGLARLSEGQGAGINQIAPQVVQVQLTTEEMNAIKLLMNLATSEFNTYIILNDSAVLDMVGNALQMIGGPIHVQNFHADDEPPTLEQFNVQASPVDNRTVQLELFFSETINVSSFVPSGIQLWSSSAAPLWTFRLTGANNVYQPEPSRLVFDITTHDWGVISNLQLSGQPGTVGMGLLQNKNYSFLTMDGGAILDMQSSPVVAVSTPLQAANHLAQLQPPYVRTFSFDLSDGELCLTFSKPVLSSSLVNASIVLHTNISSAYQSITIIEPWVEVIQSAPNSSNTACIFVNDENLDAIKEAAAAQTASPRLFQLELQRGSVIDAYGNKADAINGDLLTSTSIGPDMVSPALSSFLLNLVTNTLLMTFSEPVLALPSVTTPACALCYQPRLIDVTTGEIVDVISINVSVVASQHRVVTMFLSQDDAMHVKYSQNIGHSVSTTYLAIVRSQNTCPSHCGQWLTDLSGNIINSSASIQATSVTPDTLPAIISLFTVDLMSNYLNITFSKPVRSFTSPGSIKLYQTLTSSDYAVTLIDAYSVSYFNETYSILLSTATIDNMKSMSICLTPAGCFLTVDSGSFYDSFSNQVSQSSRLLVSVLIRDTASPVLVQFSSIDLNSGVLLLSFSEPMNVFSLQQSHARLQSDISFSPLDTSFQYLTPSLIDVRSNFSTSQVTIQMSSLDLNSLRASSILCKIRSSCFLNLDQLSFQDMSGNAVIPTTLLVSSLSRDTTRPILLNFDLDLTQGSLFLNFSKTINLATFVPSSVILMSSTSPPNNSSEYSYSLSIAVQVSTIDGLYVTIDLTASDMLQIKSRKALAKNITSTFISIGNTTIKDTAVSPNNAMPTSTPLPVRTYTADNISPILANFQVDLGSPVVLSLTFNEPVSLSAFNVTGIQLQADSIAAGAHFRLSAASNVNPPMLQAFSSNIVEIILSEGDATLLRTSPIATSISLTYISLDVFTVNDMAGNLVVAIPSSNAQQVNQLVSPNVYTTVTFAGLDLERKQLTLSFSNVIVPSTLKARGITVQSSVQSALGQVYTLTTSTTNSTFGYQAIIDLSAADMLGLSKSGHAGRSLNTTFVTVAASTFSDILGKDIIAVTDGKALQAAQWAPRITKAQLWSFNVNMSSGSIALYFSEAIDMATIDLRQITLSDGQAVNYTLSGGNFSSDTTQTVITVLFSWADLNNIKRFDSLLISRNSSFVTLDSHFSLSIFGLELLSFSLAPVSVFYPDLISPRLLHFNVNLDLHILTLHFDEVVRVASFNGSHSLIAKSSATSNPIAFSLTQLVGNSSENDYTFTVSLSTGDVDALSQRTDVFSSLSSSLLQITHGAVLDMRGNPCLSVLTTAQSVAGDFTAPVLTAWDLDFNNGTMQLTFSKVINASSLNLGAIVFQKSSVGTSNSSLTLANSRHSIGNGRIITVILSETLSAKDQRTLLTINSSYLCSSRPFATDMYGNAVEPVLCQNALQVRTYSGDITPPVLLKFDFDLRLPEALVTLTFDEPVIALSAHQSFLVLSADGVTGWLPVSFSVYDQDSAVFQATLPKSVTDSLKLSGICLSNSTCYVQAMVGFILDLSGNNCVSTTRTSSQYYGDRLPPAAVAFELDIDQGFLVLNFSEPMNATSLNLQSIRLQNQRP